MKITVEKNFKPFSETDSKKKNENGIDLETALYKGLPDGAGINIPAPLMSTSSRSVSNSSSASSSSSVSSTAEKMLCNDCNACLCPKCLKKVMELEERENSCNALYCVSAFR